MINFASDNASSVHPSIIKKLEEVNKGYASPYGNDCYTKEASEIFCKLFDMDVHSFFVFNGTGANAISLDVITEPYDMIFSSMYSHITQDECGAPARYTGCAFKNVSTKSVKVTPEMIAPFMSNKGDFHRSQPKAVSISQATEFGEVYTIEELEKLSTFCKKNELLIHMDGSRIANAVVSMGNSLENLRRTMKYVDILSFGGTKNGLMIGEAIVVKDKKIADKLFFSRKQGMQLASKMRYISGQFIAIMENNLWLNNAKIANELTTHLYNRIKNNVSVLYPVEINMIFAEIKTDIVNKLLEKFYFYPMNSVADKTTVRLMTSWDTTKEDVDMLADEIIKLSK